MTEFTMDRLRENLESLKMKNTLEILDNYLERAVAEDLNIVERGLCRRYHRLRHPGPRPASLYCRQHQR